MLSQLSFQMSFGYHKFRILCKIIIIFNMLGLQHHKILEYESGYWQYSENLWSFMLYLMGKQKINHVDFPPFYFFYYGYKLNTVFIRVTYAEMYVSKSLVGYRFCRSLMVCCVKSMKSSPHLLIPSFYHFLLFILFKKEE